MSPRRRRTFRRGRIHIEEQQSNKFENWSFVQSIKQQIALQRIATVTAIEFCEIFILDYASFKKNVEINEAIMEKLTKSANDRMKSTLRAEEEHKNQLHEKIARESFDD